MRASGKPARSRSSKATERSVKPDALISASHEFDLKDRVFRVALELFGERGFDGVSVDEIISRAEISKGGFYHHFSRKDDLLYAIEEVFMDHMVQQVEQAATSQAGSQERLNAVLRTVVDTVVNNRAYFRVFFREDAILATKRFRPIRQKRARVQELVQTIISDGIAKGEFRSDLPAGVVSSALFGMGLWTYRWFTPTADLDTDRLTALLGSIVFKGISASASGEGLVRTG